MHLECLYVLEQLSHVKKLFVPVGYLVNERNVFYCIVGSLYSKINYAKPFKTCGAFMGSKASAKLFRRKFINQLPPEVYSSVCFNYGPYLPECEWYSECTNSGAREPENLLAADCLRG